MREIKPTFEFRTSCDKSKNLKQVSKMGLRLNNNDFSDYGSGNTSDSSTMSWGGPEKWVRPDLHEIMRQNKQRSSSFVDLVMGRCTLEDVMQEFQRNGSDAPYTPDDDAASSNLADELSGMGPSGAYLRQKSWPAPERTPVARLPARWRTDAYAPPASAPAPAPVAIPDIPPQTASISSDVITEEQLRVLSSLPNTVLYSLLREMEQGRDDRKGKKKHPEECRFCKNNGERESYYRSHVLKDAGGRVRCPVLRAFVCRRCGARGDAAHTIKYCPLSSNEERMKSAAMMRSVRLASGRRRAVPDYVTFGDAPHSRDQGFAPPAPLDPLWAALEQKLML